jgi:uncharacterized membrane protein YphA (DoxX/SURF4 family)
MPVQRTYIPFWSGIVNRFGAHLLHIHAPIAVFFGDTVFEYVLTLCLLISAACVALVWSFADRGRPNYETLHEYSRLVIRLWLAAFLISYGSGKIFPAQFPEPSLSRYLERFGDFSGMGLLWSFMGVSRGYQLFAGVAELSAGLMLLAPRLTTIGAVIASAAMANVLLLNVSYDVSVKLFAAHLLAAALFLAAPDALAVFAFFFKKRTVCLRESKDLFRHLSANRILKGVQLSFGLYIATISLMWSHQLAEKRMTNRGQTPLYGIWSVEDFIQDGTTLPPLTTDQMRWRSIVVEAPKVLVIQKMDGTLSHRNISIDDLAHTMDVNGEDPERVDRFGYSTDTAGLLTLQGKDGSHLISVRLRHVEPHSLLNNHRIQWIHPFPPETR